MDDLARMSMVATQPGLARRARPRTATRSVLVVDPDPVTSEVVHRHLYDAGFRVWTAVSGGEALRVVSARRPHLLILEVVLPDFDGFRVIGGARVRAGHIPVILLTARGSEQDRIAGLRLGADDYVVKPFLPAELVARVYAVLRRCDYDPRGHVPLRFEGLEIDPAARDVRANGREIRLTRLEFELLRFLARHPHRAFTRDQLLDRVWGYPPGLDTSTVTVHVHRLRAKIEQDPLRPRFICTVRDVGYRFAG